MVELWVGKIPWRNIAQGLKPVARVWNLSPGGWITLGVLLIFGALVLRAHAGRGGHRQEIAAAFGAVNTFYGQAQLSQDGSKLAYVTIPQTRGCALYLYDVNLKETREVFVEREGLGAARDEYELRCWPWSPDGASFIYTFRDKLVVYPIDARKKAQELIVGLKTVSQVAWLAPDRFAFVNQDNNLCYARRTDDQWRQFWIPCSGDLANLVAVSSNTVAWLQDGRICRLNLDEYQAVPAPQTPSHARFTPNATISWAYDLWGFDHAQPYPENGLPVSNTLAGVVLSSNWNDSWCENAAAARAEGVTVGGLFDNSGCGTGAEITYAAYNGGGIVERHKGIDADGTYNRELLNGILRAGPAGWGSPISNTYVAFDDVPYAAYDAIVYFGSETARRNGRISDGVTSYYFSTLGPASVTGANALLRPTLETNGTLFPDADFAFFPGLTTSHCVFTSYPMSGNDQWLGISAVQLIQCSNVFLVGEIMPPTQTVVAGAPACFRVLAGGLTPRYQWRHEGTNLPQATDATYAIDAVAAEKAGAYDVVVANDFSSVTSSVASLFCVSTETKSPTVSRKTTDKAQNLAASHPKADIPTNGLILWLDAATLQQADQTPVAGMDDYSGRGNDVVVDGKAPVFNSPDGPGGLNGHGTIHFASAAALDNAAGLKTSRFLGISGAAPRSIFAVMRRSAGQGMFVSSGNCGLKGEYCGICDQEWAVYLPAGMVTDNAFPALPAQWNRLGMVYDGTTQKGYVNGVFKGASSFPMKTPDTAMELGVRWATEGDQKQSAASDGDFAELLVYDRALGADEQSRVSDYLSYKWSRGGEPDPADRYLWVNPSVAGKIAGFSYSPARGEFLINASVGPVSTLWRFDTNGALTELAKGGAIQDARWISPDHFAYLNQKAGRGELAISELTGAGPVVPFKQGSADWYAPAGANGKLLFSGFISNEPASGVWLYDSVSRELQSLVAYSDYPSAEAQKIVPLSGAVVSPDLKFFIFPPPQIDRHKKYPLIISDTVADNVAHGPMFQAAIANGGAYVALVNRKAWFWSIEDWEVNVLNLYRRMKQDPMVDPARVYLYATSAETQYMSDLVEKKPGLWRGLILLNPGQLPDFSKSPRFQARPKILLSAGGEEQEEERFKNYQTNARGWGIVVEYIIAPDEPHRMIGKAAKLERARAVEHFIFDE